MNINGTNYRLTSHGRKRFLERGWSAPLKDSVIISLCVGNPKAVWKPCFSGDGYRLVTYLPKLNKIEKRRQNKKARKTKKHRERMGKNGNW